MLLVAGQELSMLHSSNSSTDCWVYKMVLFLFFFSLQKNHTPNFIFNINKILYSLFHCSLSWDKS